MIQALPATLREAENMMLDSLLESLKTLSVKNIALDIRFEGLRLMPVAIRLSEALLQKGQDNILSWPDAGAQH